MRAQKSSTQAGFTLVELVIVILILGILSAVALPRFINLGQEARVAKVEAIHGSVRAAAQIVRAAALVRNATGATGTVAVDGATIDTVYGYPEGTNTGIVAAAGLDATADKVTVVETAGPPQVAAIQVNGATTPANCSVTYTESTGANAAPTIALDSSGC